MFDSSRKERARSGRLRNRPERVRVGRTGPLVVEVIKRRPGSRPASRAPGPSVPSAC